METRPVDEPEQARLQKDEVRSKAIVLYILLFFALWTIRATVLFPIDQSISSPGLGQLYADLLRVVIWILPVFAYIRWIDKKEPYAYLRLSTFGNPKAIPGAILSIIFYFVIILSLDFIQADRPLTITIVALSNSWLKTILVLTIAPLAEEIVYRGFILQKLQAGLSFWTSNFLTSCLFVAIHWPNWLYTGKPFLEIGITSFQIFVLSIFLGYLLRKTATLWPSIVTHMLNNAISFFIVG